MVLRINTHAHLYPLIYPSHSDRSPAGRRRPVLPRGPAPTLPRIDFTFLGELHGFQVEPVRPNLWEVLGIKSRPARTEGCEARAGQLFGTDCVPGWYL